VYAKSFIPLESDPLVLNDLMYGLGVSTSLALTDVWDINDPIQLSLISRPVLALILVLPTSEEYERHRRSATVSIDIQGDSKAEEVVWFRQTINNACGLYAILHAICNFDVRRFIGISIMLVEESFD
jgi:ubiquitin carboxyl-terminal hydrolase L3